MDVNSPIVVLDSGLGGLTVVRALRNALPNENIVYFGDTARLPYGSKSQATVTGFVKQIISYLKPLRPKHVVIACNTATALAMPSLRGEFMDLNISGVIDPGARAAVTIAGSKRVPVIGVIATEATVKSKAYDRAILRRRNLAHVYLKATPLLVHLIEEGRGNDDPVVDLVLRQYLQPLMARNLDVLVLGCTHYPILARAIHRVLGKKVAVIDSAETCAQDVAARLTSRGLLKTALGPASLRCYVTDDGARFSRLAARLLAMEVLPPTLVTLDELDSASRYEAALDLDTASVAGANGSSDTFMTGEVQRLRLPA